MVIDYPYDLLPSVILAVTFCYNFENPRYSSTNGFFTVSHSPEDEGLPICRRELQS